MNKLLKPFQNQIGALRAHHWKYYLDLYSSCYYNCKYCLYLNQSKEVIIIEDFISQLQSELQNLSNKGIVYIGARSDIYQPVEQKKQLMRNVLETFLKYEIPIFIITRSELILRDIDILFRLAQKNLVEISITTNTNNTEFSNIFEPNTPSHANRMDIAEKLIKSKIPVSFHFSPLIPFLDSYAKLFELLDEMNSIGPECIYGCIFGLPRKNQTFILEHFHKYNEELANKLNNAYINGDDEMITPDSLFIYDFLKPIADYCNENKIPFISSQIPCIDTISREKGIFEYKLPTIGDIYQFITKNNFSELHWNDLLSFLKTHKCIDINYLRAIRTYWKEGILFENTDYIIKKEKNEIIYIKTGHINLNTGVIRCK